MKKFGFLFLSFLLLSVIGCKKSDDTPDEQVRNIDKSANLLATGSSANDILSNSSFDKLLVEIAYVEGFRPTTSAMNDFVAYLRQHTFKQTVEVVYKPLPSPGEEDLELQEIADLESENRTAYNNGKTLAIYIYFADAPSNEDDEEEGLVTLGAVYRNTSMVIYESTVRRLASFSNLITTADVELSTLNHEFGHLFGLVNIGSAPVNDHEDTEAANHCNVEGCLMRAELQFTQSSGKNNPSSAINDGIKSSCNLNGKSVLAMLETNAAKGNVDIPPLDAECVLDLQANGGR